MTIAQRPSARIALAWLGIFMACAPLLAASASVSPQPIRVALIEGLSGPFANAGEAVHRDLLWASERVHARGSVLLPGGRGPLELVRMDSKGNPEEALATLRGALEGLRLDRRGLGGVHAGVMRAEDHQFQQPFVVSVMDRAGPGGVRHDVEGSGYGFRTIRAFEAEKMEMPQRCRITRPG